MKNYLLSKDLLLEIFYGKDNNKELVVSTIETIIQKNGSLFVTIPTLSKILENEPVFKKREVILKNITLLCEKLLSATNDDLPLAQGFESEFNIDHATALELLLAKKNGIDSILDISNQFQFQKMLSVINLILKTKNNAT